jgi:hypothetical protein
MDDTMSPPAAATARRAQSRNPNHRIGSKSKAAPPAKQPDTAKASKKDLLRDGDGFPVYTRERLLKMDPAFGGAMRKTIESGRQRGQQ